MDQEQEHEIIKQVLAGDRQAYALLVDAYKGPVFNLAYRMTGNYADADDLTQETFIRAFQKLEKFHQDKKFFTWLYTIGINLIRNHLKKNTRDIKVKEDESLSSTIATLEDRKQDECIKRLEAGLRRLPVDLREAIILKYHFDLTFEEIATVTGDSNSAVKMRVYRGLDKLKGWMKK